MNLAAGVFFSYAFISSDGAVVAVRDVVTAVWACECLCKKSVL